MTNEEAKELLVDIKGNIVVRVYSQYVEALDLVIKALEQEPSEDCISREVLMKLFKEYQPSLATRVCEFGDALEELPSVKPQRAKGHWISFTDHQACSRCGKWIAYYDNYNYCPNCGAYMRGDSDD